MPRAEALGVRYSQEEGRVVERGDRYLVTCDCQEEPRELTMGGAPWEHDCLAMDFRVKLEIDADGHMTAERV